jgi:uncharacterized membrane protein
MANVFDTIVDFFTTYFIDPITQHSGYNIFNTLAYAIVLVVGVYLILRLLEHFSVTIDQMFIRALLPFMVVGGTARALVDANVYPDTFLLITPGIYFTITAFTLGALGVSKLIERTREVPYHKPLTIIGLAVAAVQIALVAINIERPLAIGYILGLFAVFYVPLLFASSRFPSSFLSGNEYIVGAHIFDAATTFTGIYFYNYVEQHVLTGFAIDIAGPAVMFPLKIVFITLSLYLLEWVAPETDPTTMNIKNLLKLVIVILGLAPGIRNMSTILMGA